MTDIYHRVTFSCANYNFNNCIFKETFCSIFLGNLVSEYNIIKLEWNLSTDVAKIVVWQVLSFRKWFQTKIFMGAKDGYILCTL